MTTELDIERIDQIMEQCIDELENGDLPVNSDQAIGARLLRNKFLQRFKNQKGEE